MRNRDINSLLRWDLTPEQALEFNAGFSRQGNIYAGDYASGQGGGTLSELAEKGAETNTMYRNFASVAHKGKWAGQVTSQLSGLFALALLALLGEWGMRRWRGAP
ncbi:MAG: hypothetical protein LBR95_03395 [Azoarcus sp.]|nr:hypothetical protein [Azoarcus sp.]